MGWGIDKIAGVLLAGHHSHRQQHANVVLITYQSNTASADSSGMRQNRRMAT